MSTPRTDVCGAELPGSEYVAAEFHATYKRLTPGRSTVPWDEVPEANRKLLIAVVSDLLERNVIA